MDFKRPALLTDDEVADIISKADELSKWASNVYAFAQEQAISNGKHWPGYKVVEGRSVRKFTSDEEVIQAAQQAGYKDIFKHSLIGITEMERLMGKENFNTILGRLVYKPKGKLTLVPDTDKREAISTSSAAADFEEV